MEQSKIERNISLYVAAWNEEGLDNIKFALTPFWTDESTYTDDQTPTVTGIDAMANLMLKSYEMLPGRRFSQITHPDIHNNMGRYTWMLHRPDKTTSAGMDFFELNNNGYITRIVGFTKTLKPFYPI